MSTVPHADWLQPLPCTLHVTAVLFVPVTVAWNCCVVPNVTKALLGVTVTTIGRTTVTTADADFDGSADAVAVTVTFGLLGTEAGAV